MDFAELEELEPFFEELEFFDFWELEDDSFTELEDETFAELEELLFSLVTLEDVPAFLLLELESRTSSEPELVSGSALTELEESSPQATRKSNEQMGNKLEIFMAKIYHV